MAVLFSCCSRCILYDHVILKYFIRYTMHYKIDLILPEVSNGSFFFFPFNTCLFPLVEDEGRFLLPDAHPRIARQTLQFLFFSDSLLARSRTQFPVALRVAPRTSLIFFPPFHASRALKGHVNRSTCSTHRLAHG